MLEVGISGLEPKNYTPDVVAVHKWIEEIVIAKGFCPPLNIFAQQHRNEDRSVNWDTFDNVVHINREFADNKPDQIVESVASWYLNFIAGSILETNPQLTEILILPDFRSNQDYDDFMTNMKRLTLDMLLKREDNKKILRKGIKQANLVSGAEEAREQLLQYAKSNNVDERGFVGAQIIDGSYNPVIFYGKEITQRDLRDLTTDRGPRERAQVLSRGPFYLIQVINSAMARSYIGNLNRPGLYIANTEKVKNIKKAEFEQRLDRLARDAQKAKNRR